ncbi:N-acetylmuramoyl-L-alanine amidase [Luteimonas viscosa]|uniref:N-acetylmuramoyl-L-alanine amidase AmiC n=1 Tax=Luteimonas viscosa TaxID=1132694 RepID=A0A5D4XQF5_9GAMM|nr:N-acetylmuramoyl-L-alanine amidase [Luteimonas viscosa]TYT25162.1 N-acetylmuramoyl-L-alanine amidase [Luteimonas viscosa]
MRTRGQDVQQILLGLALLAALVWNLAYASEIRAVQLGSGPTGTRAELQVDREAGFRLITLQNPHRLVVDLPGSQPAGKLALPPPAGVVKAVRSGQPEPGTTRIVFDLAAPVVALEPRYETGPQGTRLVIEWPGEEHGDPIAQIAATSTARSAPAPAPAATTPATATATAGPPARDPALASAAATSRLVAELRAAGRAAQAPVASNSNPASPPQPQSTNAQSLPRTVPTSPAPTAPAATMAAAVTPASAPPLAAPPPPARAITAGTRPLVIAIDAGHGGQDPGAIGPSGKREKDITLAIARELARQINATPGLRAHLVRDRDVFIPLPNRARIARQAKADMFISIHADAAENRNAKGSSVYVLSLRGASSQRARWLAEKENAADLIGGVRVASSGDAVLTNVLLDLTQSGQLKASEDAGNHILAGLKRIGNNHKPHIERANFAVLRTSDMPAMLVETAFLSNPDEEKRLIDPKFQGTVARAILDGVHTYFSSQPPPGTLYAARAAADRVASTGGSP